MSCGVPIQWGTIILTCSLDKRHEGQHQHVSQEYNLVWSDNPCGLPVIRDGKTYWCLKTAYHPDEHESRYNGVWLKWRKVENDPMINHPPHYNSHPSGIECITIAEQHNFNIGNVLKYIWRAGVKVTNRSEGPAGNAVKLLDELTDLRKARWYLDREITRLEKPS